MILVSGFSGPISDSSPLSPYITKSKVDTNYFRDIKKKLVYLSDNDDLVPPQLTIQLAKDIDAPYITVLMVGTFRSGRLYGISAISRFFKRNVRN